MWGASAIRTAKNFSNDVNGMMAWLKGKMVDLAVTATTLQVL